MIRLATRSLVAIFATSCALRLPPAATAADVVWAQRNWPSANERELEAGRQVLLSKCNSCHRSPMPDEYPAQSWPGYVAEMTPRAKLTEHDRTLLERYLITLARETSMR
jgi:cytochrome c5